MNIRYSLLALSALALPGLAAAQYGQPYPQPYPVPPYPAPAYPAPRAEPWMPPPPGPAPQPWGQQQQQASATKRGPALEPIDLPPAIEQGVDMIYIDEELVPKAIQASGAAVHDISLDDWSGAPLDMFVSMNPIYTDLRRGLVKYRQRWGNLPEIPVPAGPTLKPGSTDPRVSALRIRLGLPEGNSYDSALAAAVKEFQAAHGLKADGIAGAGTIEALNRGPD